MVMRLSASVRAVDEWAMSRCPKVPGMGARVLLFSAAIGEGHDGPARTLTSTLKARGACCRTVDTLAVAGPVGQRMAGAATQYDTRWGNVAFDVAHRLFVQWPPGQRVAGRAMAGLFGSALQAAIDEARPDVVVSTYPGASEALGRLRASGRIGVPVASAITDLASLRFWAHPGIDLHLLIHAESAAEVRAIAGPGARAEAVRGLVDPRFETLIDPAAARADLDLDPGGSLVAVSGGGWAVGDLHGAVDASLEAGAGQVVVLCGRRDDVRARLAARYDATPPVAVWSFTDQMPTLLCAADVLVHSTAGLTVLEALMCGCRVVSYGWGRGHVRANNTGYARHDLATVAGTRRELTAALVGLLGRPRAAALPPALPHAADLVLDLARAPSAADRPSGGR